MLKVVNCERNHKLFGGKQQGLKDARDGFPAFIAAVKQVEPEIFLFENVRGIMYRNKWYLELIVTEFQRLGYIVEYKLFNTVHYGVPQNRFQDRRPSEYRAPNVTNDLRFTRALGMGAT